MGRVLGSVLSLAAALALLVGTAADVQAAKKAKKEKANKSKAAKVLIAHSTEIFDEFDEVTGEYLGTYYFYNVIRVSERALKRGHAGHDDILDGGTLPDGSVFDSTVYAKGDKIVLFVEPVVDEPPADEPPVDDPPV